MNSKNFKRPVLLAILDGWGFGDEFDENNAIARAKTPTYDKVLQEFPYSKLETSGLAVGLPEGQIGNSEVGHMTIGAGRVIYQDLVRINKAIACDQLSEDKTLAAMIADLKNSGKALHLLGLLSDGGVHSHQDHMAYLVDLFAKNGVKVCLHAFLDGRDVAQKSALDLYKKFCQDVGGEDNFELASVGGRYYGMDRDHKWDRVELAYNAMVKGEDGYQQEFVSFEDLVKNCYDQDITDEFVKPCAIKGYSGVAQGDALLFCNFRSDRARQISDALLDDDFGGFERGDAVFSKSVAMTQYSDSLAKYYDILFPAQKITQSLPEVLSKNNMTQLRCAETEKFAHVTFFFSCGQEKEFAGEKRVLVPSPDVATYDLQPEMSAGKVTEELVAAINSNQYDFIVVNFANPDMVGHSGNLQAAIEAVEVIDKQIAILKNEILASGGVMLITADHGNIESMVDGLGKPHTAHTTNLVPLIMISDDIAKGFALSNGTLADIAPTVLDIMKLKIPDVMAGQSLIPNVIK